MIKIDRNAVLQVNAIIITGLLLLLTLQTLGAPLYEKQVSNSIAQMNDIGIKANTMHNLYTKNCTESNSTSYFTFLNSTEVVNLCKKWEIELVKLEEEADVLAVYVTGFHILENNTASNLVKTVIWGPILSKILTGIMILPFIVSSLTEIFRNEPTTHASILSTVIFGIGFVVLLIGIVMITIWINCSIPNPILECWGSSQQIN